MIPPMFNSIVVGTDDSETAKEAVKQAAELARRVGAQLTVVSAYQPVSESRLRQERQGAPDDVQWMINPQEDVKNTLNDIVDGIRSTDLKVEARPQEGEAADAILDVAEEENADLIVVGNRGMAGAQRFLLGSVPNKISHHAPCSVLIVRTG